MSGNNGGLLPILEWAKNCKDVQQRNSDKSVEITLYIAGVQRGGYRIYNNGCVVAMQDGEISGVTPPDGLGFARTYLAVLESLYDVWVILREKQGDGDER